jgi:hypothetical protein
MTDKSTIKTKADLFKMLAEAVLNTPGATRIDSTVNAHPTNKPKAKPVKKGLAKVRSEASSGRKRRSR